MSERVLITGASGFVGYHLIEAALKNNLEVYIAVRKSSNVEHLKHFAIQYIYPDFADVDSLVSDLERGKYHYIIHAAGITKAKTQHDYDKVNADYTYNLACAANKANIPLKKFVFLSSLAALGPLTTNDREITEDTLPNPVTAYGRSKILAEHKLQTLPSLPVIVLRPTAVYGPREKDILIILKKMSQGIEPYIGKVAQRLSFIYVADLAEITVKALFTPLQNKTYNIADGHIYSRYDMGTFTSKILNKAAFKIHIPLFIIRALAYFLEKVYASSASVPALNIEKLNELTAVNWACSIVNAKTELGFKPAYDLEKGLQETLLWYKKEHWL